MTGRHSGGRVTVRDRVAAYRDASEALRVNAERERAVGIDFETEEHRRLIRDVWEAEGLLPWWLRWVLR